jgi:hypothetical protein
LKVGNLGQAIRRSPIGQALVKSWAGSAVLHLENCNLNPLSSVLKILTAGAGKSWTGDPSIADRSGLGQILDRIGGVAFGKLQSKSVIIGTKNLDI